MPKTVTASTRHGNLPAETAQPAACRTRASRTGFDVFLTNHPAAFARRNSEAPFAKLIRQTGAVRIAHMGRVSQLRGGVAEAPHPLAIDLEKTPERDPASLVSASFYAKVQPGREPWAQDVDGEALALIDMIYQAALEPGLWTVALTSLTGLLRADHGHVVMTNRPVSQMPVIAQTGMSGTSKPVPEAPFVAQTGMSDADLNRCLSPEAVGFLAPLLNPYLATLPSGRAVVQGRVLTDAEFERSSFYNEIIRPMGTFYGTAIANRGEDLPFGMWICRTRGRGGFLQHETRVLEGLFPHVRRAQTLYQRLRIDNDQAVGLATVIERLSEAAIVLDAASRPLIVNARAMEILARGDGLTQAASGLQAATPSLTDQLRKAIATAVASPTHQEQRLRLPRLGQRLPLLLDIMPVWRLGLAAPGLRAPRVVIFIREPEVRPAIDQTALIETFGLTRRECEIVCRLAEGMSVDVIAGRFRIKPGTVRHNLKSAFEKTEAHSQAALVALVRGFSR